MIVGIDYDSYKAVLCALPLDGELAPKWSTATFRLAKQSGDDAAIAAIDAIPGEVYAALARLGVFNFGVGPSVYWIERGFGMSRRADWILGVYFGAIWTTVRRLASIESDSGLNPLDLREWKRIVTADAGIGLTAKGAGNGNAPKAIANEACRAILVSESGYAAPELLTADELDAFGIAYAARKLNAGALV